MSAVNPLDHIAIKNVIARYCQALDTKHFDLLHKVFMPDVLADYPFNSDMRGIETISTAIQNRLGPVRTHHSLTTQIVTFNPDGRRASAVTHFIGVHFGQGPHEGKMLSAYGRYMDQLVLLDTAESDSEGIQGASGPWRIKSRVVVFTQRIGDEMIMKEH